MSELRRDLPGSDLLQAGLDDLRAGRVTESSLLVELAAPRLRPLGIEIQDMPESTHPGESPEHRLYDLLSDRLGDGAHSQYNALLARVASFASAAEHATSR
jgi:hypothetical protein